MTPGFRLCMQGAWNHDFILIRSISLNRLKNQELYLGIHKRGEDTGETAALKFGDTGKYRHHSFPRADSHV